MTVSRVTQEVAEVVTAISATPKSRVTQEVVEVLASIIATPKSRITQQVVEVLVAINPTAICPFPAVQGVAVIRESPYDQVWMIVRRTINGVASQFMEVMEDRFDSPLTPCQFDDTRWFLDAATIYDNEELTTVTGLDHLEGETVQIVVSGAVVPDKTVSGGSITLDNPADQIIVGLKYDSTMETMPIYPENTSTDTRHQIVDVSQVFLQLHETVGGQIGQAGERMNDIEARTDEDLFDKPPPLFTGLVQQAIEASGSREFTLTIKADTPQPMTLLAMTAQAVVGNI